MALMGQSWWEISMATIPDGRLHPCHFTPLPRAPCRAQGPSCRVPPCPCPGHCPPSWLPWSSSGDPRSPGSWESDPVPRLALPVRPCSIDHDFPPAHPSAGSVSLPAPGEQGGRTSLSTRPHAPGSCLRAHAA